MAPRISSFKIFQFQIFSSKHLVDSGAAPRKSSLKISPCKYLLTAGSVTEIASSIHFSYFLGGTTPKLMRRTHKYFAESPLKSLQNSKHIKKLGGPAKLWGDVSHGFHMVVSPMGSWNVLCCFLKQHKFSGKGRIRGLRLPWHPLLNY